MRKAWWTATAYLSAWADSPPRRWRRVSYRWTRAAISWPERPRRPAFPAFTPWAMCGQSLSVRWSPPWQTARWQSTWRRNISREASDMKKKLKKWLRPVLFTLGGALMGLGYYALVGCSTGSCAITASPVNTILYMGLMGWLLSGIFGSQSA